MQESIKAYSALVNSYITFCQTMFNLTMQSLDSSIERDPSFIAKSTEFFNGFLTGYKKALDEAPGKTNSFNKEPANLYL